MTEKQPTVLLGEQPTGLPGKPHEEAASYEQMVNTLALEVMAEARMKLMMAFRFLNTALWKMPTTIAWHTLPIATNGKEMFVSPLCVLARFEESMNQVVRDYLHLLLHCIFRHPFDTEHINVEAWSLACDIAVEAIALEMVEERFFCENDTKRREEIATLQASVGSLDPAKLYRIFADAQVSGPRAQAVGLSAARMWDLRQLFQRDAHDAWANVQHKESDAQKSEDNKGVRKRNLSDRLQDSVEDGQAQQQSESLEQSNSTEEGEENTAEEGTCQAGNQQGDAQQDGQLNTQQGNAQNGEQQMLSKEDAENTNSPAEDAGGGDAGDNTEEINDDAATAEDANDAATAEDANDAHENTADEQFQQQLEQQLEQQRQEWEDIAKQIEVDVQSFSHGAGTNANALTQNLAIANRRLANYGDFLRKFAVMGEDMKINDDEFDYIYYTYGMDIYGNMPLVEPLEYQESKRVREFVIALDTSGSCSGALIRTFVTRTYDILRETQGFGDKVNIHLIQCDNKIQADLKIENVSDLEKYCQTFQAFGFGGTDFRPVFTYVDELCEQGEFENLRGLIYFTDGLGTFPALPPAYETAFVFIDDGARKIDVPPWAMRVVMNEEEVLGL